MNYKRGEIVQYLDFEWGLAIYRSPDDILEGFHVIRNSSGAFIDHVHDSRVRKYITESSSLSDMYAARMNDKNALRGYKETNERFERFVASLEWTAGIDNISDRDQPAAESWESMKETLNGDSE